MQSVPTLYELCCKARVYESTGTLNSPGYKNHQELQKLQGMKKQCDVKYMHVHAAMQKPTSSVFHAPACMPVSPRLLRPFKIWIQVIQFWVVRTPATAPCTLQFAGGNATTAPSGSHTCINGGAVMLESVAARQSTYDFKYCNPSGKASSPPPIHKEIWEFGAAPKLHASW